MIEIQEIRADVSCATHFATLIFWREFALSKFPHSTLSTLRTTPLSQIQLQHPAFSLTSISSVTNKDLLIRRQITIELSSALSAEDSLSATQAPTPARTSAAAPGPSSTFLLTIPQPNSDPPQTQPDHTKKEIMGKTKKEFTGWGCKLQRRRCSGYA